MGWRAMRMVLDRPTMLREQLRALIAAAAGRRLHVMFPMVAEVAELDAARRLLDLELDACRGAAAIEPPTRIEVGAMVEVPALFWQLKALLQRVDFLSVGSNDLFQFLFACDRGNPALADRYDVLSPPALSFFHDMVERCRGAGVRLAVCGEMASRPLEAMALIGLGVHHLSLTPSEVGPVKAMLRSLDAAGSGQLPAPPARPARPQPARPAAGLCPGPRGGVAAERLSADLNLIGRRRNACCRWLRRDGLLICQHMDSGCLRRMRSRSCDVAADARKRQRCRAPVRTDAWSGSAQQLRAARLAARRGASGHRRRAADQPGLSGGPRATAMSLRCRAGLRAWLPAQLRRHLGLDGEQLVARLKAAVAAQRPARADATMPRRPRARAASLLSHSWPLAAARGRALWQATGLIARRSHAADRDWWRTAAGCRRTAPPLPPPVIADRRARVPLAAGGPGPPSCRRRVGGHGRREPAGEQSRMPVRARGARRRAAHRSPSVESRARRGSCCSRARAAGCRCAAPPAIRAHPHAGAGRAVRPARPHRPGPVDRQCRRPRAPARRSERRRGRRAGAVVRDLPLDAESLRQRMRAPAPSARLAAPAAHGHTAAHPASASDFGLGHGGIERSGTRHRTHAVRVGNVMVGGGAPVVVQSMTNTDTADVDGDHAQVTELARAGSEIVRDHRQQRGRGARRARAARAAGPAGPSTCRWSATSTTTAIGCWPTSGDGAGAGQVPHQPRQCRLRREARPPVRDDGRGGAAPRAAGADRRQLGQPRPGSRGPADGPERRAEPSRSRPTSCCARRWCARPWTAPPMPSGWAWVPTGS